MRTLNQHIAATIVRSRGHRDVRQGRSLPRAARLLTQSRSSREVRLVWPHEDRQSFSSTSRITDRSSRSTFLAVMEKTTDFRYSKDFADGLYRACASPNATWDTSILESQYPRLFEVLYTEMQRKQADELQSIEARDSSAYFWRSYLKSPAI